MKLWTKIKALDFWDWFLKKLRCCIGEGLEMNIGFYQLS